jgi:hypothetical protein
MTIQRKEANHDINRALYWQERATEYFEQYKVHCDDRIIGFYEREEAWFWFGRAQERQPDGTCGIVIQ